MTDLQTCLDVMLGEGINDPLTVHDVKEHTISLNSYAAINVTNCIEDYTNPKGEYIGFLPSTLKLEYGGKIVVKAMYEISQCSHTKAPARKEYVTHDNFYPLYNGLVSYYTGLIRNHARDLAIKELEDKKFTELIVLYYRN